VLSYKSAAFLSGYEKPVRTFVHSKNRPRRKAFILMIPPRSGVALRALYGIIAMRKSRRQRQNTRRHGRAPNGR
jgi:hypothetical protein